MTGTANENQVSFTRIGIDSLFNTQEEEECAENVDGDSLAAQGANITAAPEGCNEKGKDSEEEDDPSLLKKVMKVLAIALNVLEKNDKHNFVIRRAIRSTQR